MKKNKTKEQLLKDMPDVQKLVFQDRKRFEKIAQTVVDQIKKANARHSYTESFLLSWAFVEQILLPSLIRETGHKLSLKKLPKLDGRIPIAQLILYYYFLSHDLKLYEKLVKGNNMRRKMVHQMQTDNDISGINKRAKEAAEYITKEIIVSMLDRSLDGTNIPVLTLYSKGWNDCRKQIIKKIKEKMD